jgi:SAM-dependent methyltransferase
MKTYLQSTRSEPVYSSLMSEIYDTGDYGQITKNEVDFYVTLARGKRTLELGSGTGRLFMKLREAGIDIYGIESSAPMLSQLRNKGDGDCSQRVLLWDALRTPYPWPDGHFDCIIIPFSTFGLLHSNETELDDNRVLHECHRLLSKGGRVAINDMRVTKLNDRVLDSSPEIEVSEHWHRVHGRILNVESSRFSVRKTRLLPRQLLRHRRTMFVRDSDLVPLNSFDETVPVWDIDGFTILAEDAQLRHLTTTTEQIFHYVGSVTHVFER